LVSTQIAKQLLTIKRVHTSYVKSVWRTDGFAASLYHGSAVGSTERPSAPLQVTNKIKKICRFCVRHADCYLPTREAA
jgi:hypothetical protein